MKFHVLNSMHPVDSEAWETFDSSYVCFSMDPQKVRLALSTDNFEPSRHGANHIIWPVTLLVYNFPHGCS